MDYTAGSPPVTAVANHYVDDESVAHMEDYIKTELAQGSLLRPFDTPPFKPWTQISLMMTWPKHGSNKRRVIVDLSYPRGVSVNTGMRRAQYKGQPSTYTLP